MMISEDSARAASSHSHVSEATLSASNSSASRRAFISSEAMRQAMQDKDNGMATSEARHDELLAFNADRVSWRIYRTLCQLRFGYLSFLVLMTILMFSFTLLMEIFFSIFLPSARTFSTEYIVRSVIFLVLLPFVLFVLSYFFEEASRFFFDAINKYDGGLPNFRLALAVVIHYVRHRSTFKARAAAGTAARQSIQRDSIHSDDAYPHRASILMTEQEDPFVDTEEKDLEDEVQEWEQALEEAAKDEPFEDIVATSPARSRWKKAGGAVLIANKLKKTNFEGPPVGLSTFLIVDFVCPVVFEAVTIIMFVLEVFDTWSFYSAFLAYVRNGFWLMGAYLVLWIVCHFWSSRNPHMRLLVSHYRRKRRNLRREVRKIEREKRSEQLWLLDVGFRFYHHVAVHIHPLQWCRRKPEAQAESAPADLELAGTEVQSVDKTVIRIDEEQRSLSSAALKAQLTAASRLNQARRNFRSKNPWYRLSYGTQATILLVASVIAALISLLYFEVGWPLLGVCLIMLSRVIQRRFPQIFGSAFRHFITAFVVLSLVFFSSTIIIGTFVKGGKFKLGMPTNDTLAVANPDAIKTVTSYARSQTIEYPVCSIDYDGFSVLDLALIADAAYGSTPEIQEAAVANRFNGTDLQTMKVVNHSTSSEHQVWMELYAPSLNMTVVAIRGTASATDALEDLHYWFGITIMQSVNMFIPFLKQLPHDFVVSLLSMRYLSSVMPPPVFQPLEDHVARVKARVGDRLVVTGHSLGGAMAAMTGAKAKAQAVSFSGPGLLYSRGRFDVDEQDVRDYVLTLKPQRDIVPQVDALGGMVQELRCREKSPMGCHSTNTHMCELVLACGDSRRRNWATNVECGRYQTLPPVSTASE